MADTAPPLVSGELAEAVLRSPHACVVAPPVPGGALAAGRARMARFRDGPAHVEARRRTEAILEGIDTAAVVERTRRLGRGGLAPGVDAVEWCRRTVAAVMAGAVGAGADRAPALRAVSRALAPASATLVAVQGDRVWDEAVAAVGSPDPLDAATRIALVHQALDATTGLVAAALLVDGGTPTERLAAALAAAPPVVLTSRRLDAALVSAAGTWPAGTVLDVALDGRPFGAGPHRCPGEHLALALAATLVACVLDAGLRAGVPAPPEPRRNLRIPAALPLQRRAVTSRSTAS